MAIGNQEVCCVSALYGDILDTTVCATNFHDYLSMFTRFRDAALGATNVPEIGARP